MKAKWYGLFMALALMLLIAAIAAHVTGMEKLGVVTLLAAALVAFLMPKRVKEDDDREM